MLCISTFIHNFAPANAQMAELVDALVSNTNAARRAGSIPALGTRLKSKVCWLSISYDTLFYFWCDIGATILVFDIYILSLHPRKAFIITRFLTA